MILAPYGLSATLTGNSYKEDDSASVSKLMKDWSHFYPLDQNRYYSQDVHGDLLLMPTAVEVLVAGVKMFYPTCYVLATDIDNANSAAGGMSGVIGGMPMNAACAKTMHTFRNSGTNEEKRNWLFYHATVRLKAAYKRIETLLQKLLICHICPF